MKSQRAIVGLWDILYLLVLWIDALRLLITKHFGERRFRDPRTIDDFRAASDIAVAWKPLAREYINHVADGISLSEATAKTRAEFDSPKLSLCPRVLRDVGNCSTRTTLFGFTYAMPVIVAPTAVHCLVTQQGECATARATDETGAGFCYNFCLSSRKFEDVVAATPGRGKWLHLYMFKEREIIENAVRIGQTSGAFSAIIVTCDHPHSRVQSQMVPLAAKHYRSIPKYAREAFMPNIELALGTRPLSMTEKTSLPTLPGVVDPGVTWKDIAWIKRLTSLPIIVKGVLNAEDARLAVEHGASGIVVSNHGFRQVGGCVPSLTALPSIVAEVGSEVDVFVDSGIRRSSDVVKALALGAKAVLVGRPSLWALSLQGQSSLVSMLSHLREDIEADLMSIGCTSVTEVSGHCLWKSHL